MTVINDTDDSHLLSGSSGNDTINGNGGDDTIQGSGGADSLNGGAGNDLFILDYQTPDAGSIVDGGADSDTVSAIGAHLAGVAFSNVEVLLAGNQYVYMNSAQVAAFQSIRETATDATDAVYVALTDAGTADFSANAAQGIGVYTYAGSSAVAGGDTVTTGIGNDTITAAGNNGVAGTEVFHAGGGADRIVLDYLDFAGGSVDGGGGTDTVSANYADISSLTLTSVDILESGPSFTRMKAGQAGEFQSIVVSGSDATTHVTIVLTDSGTADFSANVPQGIDVAGIDGGDTITTGSGNDTIHGHIGPNVFHAGGGDDLIALEYLTPGGGTLDGGSGADTLRATGSDLTGVTLSGIDILETGATYVTVGTAQLAGLTAIQQSDADTVDAVSLTLADSGLADFGVIAAQGVSVVASILGDTIKGSASADHLVGRDGDDALDGRGGADTMAGGLGNDLFYVDNTGDQLIEGINNGSDTVIASLSYTLASGQSIDWLITGNASGTDPVSFTGNGLAQHIEGNAGANRLDGYGGGDTLIGHAGDDVYLVRSAADQVIETDGEGADTIFATASYAIAPGQSIERLATAAQAGTTALNLTGNDNADHIMGNNGANLVAGGGGADVLYGYGGNDTIIGGAASDTIDTGNGRDVVRFNQLSDSTGVNRDVIYTMNLGATDKFDFPVVPTSIHAEVTTGSLSTASFDSDLAAAIHTSSQLGAHQAVLFDPNGGDLNVAGHLFLIVDVNGQAGADYVVELVNPTGTLTTDDFI